MNPSTLNHLLHATEADLQRRRLAYELYIQEDLHVREVRMLRHATALASANTDPRRDKRLRREVEIAHNALYHADHLRTVAKAAYDAAVAADLLDPDKETS